MKNVELLVIAVVSAVAAIGLFQGISGMTGGVSWGQPFYPIETIDYYNHANEPDWAKREYGLNYGMGGSDVPPSQIGEPYQNPKPTEYVCCNSVAMTDAGLTDCPTDPYDFEEYCTLGQSPEGAVYKHPPCSAPEVMCPVP